MKKIIPVLCLILLITCFAACATKDNDAGTTPGSGGNTDASGSPGTSPSPSPSTSQSNSPSPDVSSPGASTSPGASESPAPSESPGAEVTIGPGASPEESASPEPGSPPPTTASPGESASPGTGSGPETSPEPPASPDPGGDTGPGSGPESGNSQGINDSLENLMERLYANLDDSVTIPFVFNTQLSEDMEFPESGIVYYIGARGIPFTDGIASEAMIGSLAHSVVLLRLAPGSDIDGVKKQMREGIDPMKWICNGVTRDEVVVENIGDVVLLVLSPNGPEYRDAFFKLAD